MVAVVRPACPRRAAKKGGATWMTLRVRYVGLDRIAAVVAPTDACIAVPEYLFAAATAR